MCGDNSAIYILSFIGGQKPASDTHLCRAIGRARYASRPGPLLQIKFFMLRPSAPPDGAARCTLGGCRILRCTAPSPLSRLTRCLSQVVTKQSSSASPTHVTTCNFLYRPPQLDASLLGSGKDRVSLALSVSSSRQRSRLRPFHCLR